MHVPGTLVGDAPGHKHCLNYCEPILWGEGPESGELKRLYGVYRIGGGGVGGGGLSDALLVQLGLQIS